MAEVRIENEQGLRDWLETRPREDAEVIAARAALRVVPNLASLLHEKADARHKAIILPILRATLTSSVAGWGIATEEVLRSAAHSADSAAFSAARSAYSAARSAFSAADSAARSADRSAVWNVIEADATMLGRLDTASGLGRSQLWPKQMPDWASKNWQSLRTALLSAEDEDWGVWVDWYEARLRGDPINEALELARIQIPNEIWDAGPKVLNAEMRRLEAVYAPKPKPRPRLTIKEALALVEQDDRGFRFDAEADHFVLDASASSDIDQIQDDLPMIRNRAARLVRAFETANYPIQQDCADDARLFLQIVEGDAEAVGKKARHLWNLSIGFGSAFERDTEERKRDGELLTTDQRAAVDIFLATSANFVRLFPAVREMDSENELHRGIERRQELTTKLIETSVECRLLVQADANIMLALAQIANEATKQSPKAANALDATKTNLLKQALLFGAKGAGFVAAGALTQAGVQISDSLEIGQHSLEFIRAAQDDIRVFIGSLPADIRAPMSHAMDLILNSGDDNSD